MEGCMRCLYCGKQLALFKKLTGGGEFCSDAHKQKYHEEYNRLALNRLMEAQSRQEEQTVRRPLGEPAASAPENSAFVEPTARGGYFRQRVSARNAPLSAPSADACAPVARAIDFPALATEAQGERELPFGGLVVLRGAAHGASPIALPPPSRFPAIDAGTVVLPACSPAEIRSEPELPEAAVIIDRQPRVGSNGTSVAALAGCMLLATDGVASAVALPECLLTPVGAASPEAGGATQAEPYDVVLAAWELRCEPAAVFEYFCGIPASLEPEWVGGLEFAAEGAGIAPLARPEVATAELEITPACAVKEEPEREPVAVSAAEGAEPETAAATVSEAETAEVIEVKAAEVLPGIAPATHEPVINEDVLRALFGGNDDAEPAPPPPVARLAPLEEAPPAGAVEAAPAGAAEAALSGRAEAPRAPSPVPVADAQAVSIPPAAPKPAASRVEASVSREPLPFLEVSIRPAAPGKPRLMQTFQAISLVTATPQLPAWNMLPLRPRMGFGREPGPGAALLERSKTQNGASTATEEPPDEASMDLPVPSFASAGKTKSGLSRWFKLGVMVGALGLAGGYGAGERAATIVNAQHMSWSLQNAGNE